MLRTRALDERLKQVFAEGMETPDGGRFGGKGFRSTWQEGVVAIATALERIWTMLHRALMLVIVWHR